MKQLTIGIIAHVDSGKTTLSEAMLFLSGARRSFGRVDKGDSLLDSDALERRRGITIFSKQARFVYGDTRFVLIDTPGHADFSAETERTLQILDCAILLVGATDGIRGQTKLLFELLETYHVPTVLFFNKMDQDGADRTALLEAAEELTDHSSVDLTALFRPCDDSAAQKPVSASNSSDTSIRDTLEQVAMCAEEAMDAFLDTDTIPDSMIREMIRARALFPCLFGSALQTEGVDVLLALLDRFAAPRPAAPELAAQVYKITRDPDGQRLTFARIIGGILRPKDLLTDGDDRSKINQIRLYSGEKYTLTDEAQAGEICALTGLSHTRAGEILTTPASSAGHVSLPGSSIRPRLIPVLSYRVLTAANVDPVSVLPIFRELEEESPELSVRWDETQQAIYVSVMGTVQLEILTSILADRFDLHVTFDAGEVLYLETISEPVIGVGHFEPLRHYAEVHLLIEPLPRGSGLIFDRALTTDRLAENWQRLILTHLKERTHCGVLTGAPITDLKITLIAGRAHQKHTEGGDFRQAVYRAVRQGLMMTDSLLLEPYYRFSLEVPSDSVGRAMHDLDRMHTSFSAPDSTPGGSSVITGRGPVAAMRNYPTELASYTGGNGSIQLIPDGYDICHNADEVIARTGYDPLRDPDHTPDSVFCSHGAGHAVPYNEVYRHMHIPFDSDRSDPSSDPAGRGSRDANRSSREERFLGPDEVDAIIAGISGANQNPRKAARVWKHSHRDDAPITSGGYAAQASKRAGTSPSAFPIEEADVLLVDGYNMIFAGAELSALANENIDAARDALIELLSKYKSMVHADVITVFDAYKVDGRSRENITLSGIQVVFTAQDETADQYIERYTNEHAKKRRVAVVTSDSAERTIARGQGCMLISSAAFHLRIADLSAAWNARYEID